MDQLQPSDVVILLQTHGLDLLAQVEATSRCVRDIQHQVAVLKDAADADARGTALNAIRDDSARLVRENEEFVATVREVEALAARLSPERRRCVQFVMWDRRRRV